MANRRLTSNSVGKEHVQHSCKDGYTERIAEHDLAIVREQGQISAQSTVLHNVLSHLSPKSPPDKASVRGMPRPGVDARLDQLMRRQLFVRDTVAVDPSQRLNVPDIASTSHMREIAAGGDHGERAENLATDKQRPAWIMPTSRVSKLHHGDLFPLSPTDEDHTSRLLVCSPARWKVCLFENMLEHSDGVSDVIRVTVVQEKSWVVKSESSQLSESASTSTAESSAMISRLTRHGQLARIPHARDDEFE